MKKLVFIMTLFALCLHFNQARAQRYLPGMKGLQVTAGMADGVHWNSNTDFDFAYHIGAAYSVYTKNANRWVIGGEYLHKKYDYKDMRIPHGGGQLLPEIPFGQAQDLLPLAGAFGSRRV